MKKSLLIFCCICAIYSCEKKPEKNSLLEAEINGQVYSFTGHANRYTDYINGVKTGYDYHIYNIDKQSLFIEAYDDSFTKVIFAFPGFSAKYIVELPDGLSKTYQATKGEFRIIGEQYGNFRGDFKFTVKNILNPSDSVVIKDGYFNISLEKHDRTFPK
jgi:hypothetical protein